MAPLTRQEVLNILQRDWAEYIRRFRCLSPASQSAFLVKQGYVRFADLLAHIVAWWQVGYRSVERYLADPAAQPKQYDVDTFNAEAVAKVAGLSEEQVVESFEQMRSFLVEFIKGLPDITFENEKVVNQLSMDVVGHLSEHEILERE